MAGRQPGRTVRDLGRELKRSADPCYRKTIQTFFKEPIRVYGVRTPDFRRISRDYWQKVKHLSREEVLELCEELLAVRNGEERGVAFDWAYRLRDQYRMADFSRFQRWLEQYVGNWAACDTLSTGVLAEMLLRFPPLLPRMKKWARSKNRWLRRAAAVVFIIPNRHGRFVDDAFETADALLEDPDDMVQKGYGWMLKEIANHDQRRVFDYVMKNRHRMPRTALRYAIEKMPPALKRRAMSRP